jgi:hypothetical protein
MPILERLGLIKSRGLSANAPSSPLTEDEKFIEKVLDENDALLYPREISPQDLAEMGITDPEERATAWRLLREAAKNTNLDGTTVSQPTPTQLKRNSSGTPKNSSSTKKTPANRGLLSQDGQAWGAEEHWKGWRQERLTCGYFPCCLCAWLCRKTFSDAESYSLTNVALFVSVRSGVFCPTVRLMTIYLHSITSLTIIEVRYISLCGQHAVSVHLTFSLFLFHHWTLVWLHSLSMV